MQYNVHDDEIRIDSEISLHDDAEGLLSREAIIRNLIHDRDENNLN